MLTELRRLREHLAWADDAMLDALASAPDWPAEAAREFAHVLGSDENWLARIEGRGPRCPIWPDSDQDYIRQLALDVRVGYARHLDTLIEADLLRVVTYTNTAGISFETPVRDILYQVFLHAHYHRGKVNLLLKQAGIAPAPVDYIAYARGFPTAVTKVGAR
ncbi:MAG: DinB family protein [Gemmatimonadaceae bacterium]|nr:DinB family protein [Gemmatimonadaceae bacterium]